MFATGGQLVGMDLTKLYTSIYTVSTDSCRSYQHNCDICMKVGEKGADVNRINVSSDRLIKQTHLQT